MKFTVVWTKEAMDDLMEIWTQSADRQAITKASDRIDAVLRRNPLGVGKAMVDDGRMLFEVPLAVTFRVSDADRLVTVNFVCRF